MEDIKNNSGHSDNSKNSGSDNVWMPLSKDWNKERLTQLKKLFPDLFTNEGKLNIDELKKVVDPASVSETERYEFRWFGKSAAKRNAYTPSNVTLMYDEHRSVNPNESENLIIEGENLEVLKLLSESYREQIKCIYIDPPYNTGKDFVYSDNFTEDKKPYWEQTGVTENGIKIDTNVDTDGRYHSNWLNMMYSRLLIARQLLREDGVIFISIDDNEVHHLRKLCDEVFGEENFIGNIIWNSTKSVTNTALISVSHTYNLIFAKDKNYFIENRNEFRLPENGHGFNNPDNDLRGEWKADPFQVGGWRPNQQYEIVNPKTGEKYLPNIGCSWKNDFNKFQELLQDNRIIFGVNGEAGPQRKRFLYEALERGKVAKTLWDEIETTTNATVLLKSILEKEGVFDNPKPTSLIKKIIQLSDFNKNGIILDFFAGSGTTGQAVMELNKEDGGKRKFILVQIPEATDENSEAFKAGYKKISDITIERNRRVVEKIKSELELQELKNEQNLFVNSENSGNSKNSGSDNLGFKVFKLVKSNFPRVEWAPDVEKSDEENIASLKKFIADKEAQLVTLFNRDELLTEILLKNGFQLNYKVYKQEQFMKNEILLATDGIKETLICLDVTIEVDTVEYFKKHTDKKFLCLEGALDTTKKYNLKHYLGDMFKAF